MVVSTSSRHAARRGSRTPRPETQFLAARQTPAETGPATLFCPYARSKPNEGLGPTSNSFVRGRHTSPRCLVFAQRWDTDRLGSFGPLRSRFEGVLRELDDLERAGRNDTDREAARKADRRLKDRPRATRRLRLRLVRATPLVTGSPPPAGPWPVSRTSPRGGRLRRAARREAGGTSRRRPRAAPCPIRGSCVLRRGRSACLGGWVAGPERRTGECS